METSAFMSPCVPTKQNTSFSCFLLKTTIDCCGYTLSISQSTTMILNLLLIHFHAWEFERPFCWRCLNEIANLCATYGHHMLLLLPFDSLPLQLNFTPFPSKQKKKGKRYLYTLWRRAKLKTSAFTVVIQPLATRLIKPNFWYLYTDGHTDK